MAVEQYRNNSRSALSAAIDDSQTTISVEDGAQFPSVPDFRLRIADELLLATGIAGNDVTVTRGAEGSVAAAHNSGLIVEHILTAESVQNLIPIIHGTGSVAARPAASREGHLYHPDDGGLVYRDDGSDWSAFGPSMPFLSPVDAEFSWVNQGTAQVDSDESSLTLSDSGAASSADDYNIRLQSAPVTPYQVTVALLPLGVSVSQAANDDTRLGILMRDSGSGQLYILYIGLSQVPQLRVIRAVNPSSAAAETYVNVQTPVFGGVWWLRMFDDGVNRGFEASSDGQHFDLIHTIARASGLTPNQCGIHVFRRDFGSGTAACSVTMLSWREEPR